MLVVGFDTATPAVSVALHDGERVVSSALTVDARRQGELLAPMIGKVMADAGAAQADLTGVAVGVGPGPYTGLRVGLVTAKVLGEVLGIPVYGVCTLDIIAAAAAVPLGGGPAAVPLGGGPAAGPAGAGFLVATDARRKEVYWARYDASGQRVAAPQVGAATGIPDAGALPVAGDGGRMYAAAFGVVIEPPHSDARTLCSIVTGRLAGRAGAELLPPEPMYLRRPDAREPGAPKRVTQR